MTAEIEKIFARRQCYWQHGYRPLAVWSPDQRVNDKGEPLRNPGKQPRGRWRVDASRDPPDAVCTYPDPRALNTGLLLGDTAVAFDVDVLDQALADQIVELIEHKLGPTPLVRIGRAPKILLVYRPQCRFTKVQTPEIFLSDGTKAKVELLADGQQFVADGIHPDTGEPYTWTDGTPADVPLEQLPVICEEEAHAIIAEAEQLLRAAGGREKEKSRTGRPKSNGAVGNFFSQVNFAALADIAAWVRALFPRARFEPGTGAWRISSEELGRDLEEDISIHPEGIRDFGEEMPLSAVDLVMRHAPGMSSAKEAALWLCNRLGIDPASLRRQYANGGNDDDASTEWADPDMEVLRLHRRPPPELPLDCFGPWQSWIIETAKAAACSVDYVAMPLLSAASVLIGNSRWPAATPGWSESPHLWVAVVGDSGAGKSPGADAMFRDVLPALEREMIRDFPDRLRDWRAAQEAAKAYEEKWKSEVRDAHKRGLPPPLPPKAGGGIEPQEPRLRMSDITIERIAMVLATAAPKGLLITRDELAGWIDGMNSYNPAGRAFWIEAYGGRPYRLERQKHPMPINIPMLAVGVFGGTQPDKLAMLMREADDGLLSRFFWSWPAPTLFRLGRRESGTDWAFDAFNRLRELDLQPGDPPRPVRIPFTDDARDMMETFGQAMENRQTLAGGLLRSTLGKARGHALRLALVLEFLWWCGDDGITLPPSSIDARAFAAATSLVSNYYVPMAERVFGDAAATTPDRNAATLARWIVGTHAEEVYVRHLQRKERLPGLKTAEDIHEAAAVLVEADWLRDPAPMIGKARGRARASYPVNPRVWELTPGRPSA